MAARLIALLCVLVLAAPGAALAQGGGAFQPLPPAPPDQPVTAAPNQGADDDEGLSQTQQLLIGLSAMVLLFGIGWAIVRDARSVAPVDARPATPTGDAPQPRGSRTPAGTRHQHNRAKAKAARQARKKARRR